MNIYYKYHIFMIELQHAPLMNTSSSIITIFDFLNIRIDFEFEQFAFTTSYLAIYFEF